MIFLISPVRAACLIHHYADRSLDTTGESQLLPALLLALMRKDKTLRVFEFCVNWQTR
jgi:hypothetical protein